jgi:hypothetical protein
VGQTSLNNYYEFTQQIVMPISQGMIDAGFGGFDAGAPNYISGAAERINELRLVAVIERYSPGSTFDYYGNI